MSTETSPLHCRPTIRQRALRSFGVVSNDRGLATTETVILTAFLVIIAATGGWIILNALNSNASSLSTPSVPSVTTN